MYRQIEFQDADDVHSKTVSAILVGLTVGTFAGLLLVFL